MKTICAGYQFKLELFCDSFQLIVVLLYFMCLGLDRRVSLFSGGFRLVSLLWTDSHIHVILCTWTCMTYIVSLYLGMMSVLWGVNLVEMSGCTY